MNLSSGINEFNNLKMNTLFSEKRDLERFMKEETIQQLESQQKQNNIRIVFQFPAKSEKDEDIKKEIKGILASALQEQLHILTS